MPKHPTKPDKYAALEVYVAAAMPLLNLANWRVTILTDVAPEDRYADIEPNDQAQTANLRVGNLFWAQKPEEQRSARRMRSPISSRLRFHYPTSNTRSGTDSVNRSQHRV